MNWALTQTAAPAETPVTLAEAKNHLRVDVSDDDSLITAQIESATKWVEEYVGRTLVDATWKLTLDRWPLINEIRLQRPPVTSITSVIYTKSDDTTDTFTDYFLDDSDDYGNHRIVLDYQASWPSETLRPAAAVAVTYDAGFGAAADVPYIYKTAILAATGSLYENRETEIVGRAAAQLKHSVEHMLYNHRVWH